MSRVARKPIVVSKGVDVKIQGQEVVFNGSKGQIRYSVHEFLFVKLEIDILQVNIKETSESILSGVSGVRHSIFLNAMLGTTCAQLRNAIIGVNKGFERKLLLKGVGYRAQLEGRILNLSLGFSHLVRFKIPEKVTVEMPTQTEIIIKGVDKQQVGQVAASIRSIRPVERYKGKGIRYEDEVVILKKVDK